MEMKMLEHERAQEGQNNTNKDGSCKNGKEIKNTMNSTGYCKGGASEFRQRSEKYNRDGIVEN